MFGNVVMLLCGASSSSCRLAVVAAGSVAVCTSVVQTAKTSRVDGNVCGIDELMRL
jgi:hypothetical protein